MPPRKSAGWFFVRFLLFLLYFFLLLLPWPGLGETYGAFYRATANVLFCSFGSHGSVQVEPLDDAEHGRDMRLILENTQKQTRSITDGRTRLMGYQPTVFLVALTLATPLSWPRRWKALAWGLAGVNLYVAFRLLVLLAGAFSGDDAIAVFSPGVTLRAVLELCNWVFVVSFAGSFVVPVGIWFLATFRREDWALLIGDSGQGPSDVATH